MSLQQKRQAAGAIPGNTSRYFLTIALSVITGIASALAALLGCSWIICNAELPFYTTDFFAITAVGIGAAVTGLLLVNVWSSACSGLASGLFFCFAVAGAAFASGQREFDGGAFLKLICLLLFGCVGSSLGKLSRNRSRKCRRKRAH